MREIKFRIWDVENKRFPNAFTKNFAFVGFEVLMGAVDFSNSFKEFNEKFVLQQFTGLKDHKGKEIYEGDIVFANEDFWTVVFEEGLFGLQFNKQDKIRPLYQYPDCVVRGNIFENPELVKLYE